MVSDAPQPAESTEPRQITLAILAGGAGSRMGAPKGSLLLHGRPILEYLLDRFAWLGPTMLVLAPGIDRPAGAERFGQVVGDPTRGLGPLRGVLTALEHATTDITVVTTVDMPQISQTHLLWIGGKLNGLRGACGAMGLRSTGQVEPFPSAYRASAASAIARELAEARRAVHGLLRRDGFLAIEAPGNWPLAIWTNLNTPADVKDFHAGL